MNYLKHITITFLIITVNKAEKSSTITYELLMFDPYSSIMTRNYIPSPLKILHNLWMAGYLQN